MGRSPGKWIKTVLFGKKSSRSNLSKGKDNLRSSHEKEALVSSTTPAAGLVVSAPLISQTEPIQNQKNGENTELEQQAASNLPRDGVDILPGNQGTTTVGASNGADRIRQEQAATKAQAAFRGYLARRAFRALMGIIRLQALVRGHLVRRQAVATLCCVQGIVKFQALVRGQREDAKVSKSCGSHSFIHAEKLLANSFICKLLASSPNAKPLCLQYELAESNSAWSWLERWTKLRVWALPQRKKVVESKSITKPKRSVRRVSGANVDNASNRSVSASDKPKRSMRKISSNPVDIGQEGSQNELEKVKRSLRKVSNSTNEIPDHKEVEVEKPKRNPRKISGAPGVLEMGEPVETEKPKHNPRKASGSKSESTDQVEAEGERLKCIPRKSLGSTAPDVPDQDMVESAEKKKDAPDQLSKDTEEECIPKPLPEDEIVDVFHGDHSTFDSSPLGNYEKDENSQVTNGKLISKEDQASNENQKASRRRTSLPAKQELLDTGLQNSPKVPSYMAATESVKAKLRAQGSPKPVPDVADQNGLTRRHSLPSSINGKMSSLSPRTQRPQANSKGVIKHDRSILSSKDGNEKVAQVEWKR